ncbi:hypothetical protein [Streptomonospora sediminis]
MTRSAHCIYNGTGPYRARTPIAPDGTLLPTDSVSPAEALAAAVVQDHRTRNSTLAAAATGVPRPRAAAMAVTAAQTEAADGGAQ